MMTRYRAARTMSLAVSLFAVPHSAPAQTSDARQALVRVYATRPSGTTIGTGVFIDNAGTVLTAYHVIQGATSLAVYTAGSLKYTTYSLKGFDERRDLATFVIPAAAGTYSPLRTASVPPDLLRRKDPVVWGFPDGKPATRVPVAFIYDGVEPSRRFPGPNGAAIFAVDDVGLIWLDGTLNRGMSGGPILLDGVVIGVVSGSESLSGRNLGWAIPVGDVDKSLKPGQGRALAALPPVGLLKSGVTRTLLKSTLPADRHEQLLALTRSEDALRSRFSSNAAPLDAALQRLRAVSGRVQKLDAAYDAAAVATVIEDTEEAMRGVLLVVRSNRVLGDEAGELFRTAASQLENEMSHMGIFVDRVKVQLTRLEGELGPLLREVQRIGLTQAEKEAIAAKAAAPLRRAELIQAVLNHATKTGQEISKRLSSRAPLDSKVDGGPAVSAFRSAEAAQKNQNMDLIRRYLLDAFAGTEVFSAEMRRTIDARLDACSEIIEVVATLLDFYFSPEMIELQMM